jgi:hypothetical protein
MPNFFFEHCKRGCSVVFLVQRLLLRRFSVLMHHAGH